jgi:hypothetical protein
MYAARRVLKRARFGRCCQRLISGRLTVDEIVIAFAERNDGNRKSNTMMSQMGKVTHRNAISAEETSALAKELQAQARVMTEFPVETFA